MITPSQLRDIPADTPPVKKAFESVLGEITSHLDDPRDLSSLALTSMGLKERIAQDNPWSGVAKALKKIFPWVEVNTSEPLLHREHARAYLTEFHSLMSDVAVPDAQSTADTSGKYLTIERMQKLLQARDKLIVWKTLAEHLQLGAALSYQTPSSYEESWLFERYKSCN